MDHLHYPSHDDGSFIAHSAPPDRPGVRPHGLRDHLEATSRLAGEFAAPFGASKAAALAGLMHDLGKYAPDFQRYIRGATTRGVEHAIAGARWLDNLNGTLQDRLVGAILAHCVAGHHAGLPDTFDQLQKGLERPPVPLDPGWTRDLAPDTIDLFPAKLAPTEIKRSGFEMAFLGRMLFSALVDADYKDTEAYYAVAEGREIDRDWPRLPEILAELIARFDARMTDITTRSDDNPVNALRQQVLVHVRAQATRAPDCFTLTVPTGGGKTLTSLGFALDHARAHGKTRIVYAIPFTSVIDQTASIFKSVLGEDVVLEHHCAMEETQDDDQQGRSARDKLRLAMEDWAAPIVVTTHVQVFESLFAARPSRCRKLHALANAVIVLDEAQTIPLGLLKPCVAALRELVRGYGASVVLCTATQPALDERHFVSTDPLMGLPLEGKELAPDPASLFRQLARVTFRIAGPMMDSALLDEVSDVDQGLVIVNSRKHALSLFRAARAANLEGLFHLSTRQCAFHRRVVLAAIRDRLRTGQPCHVIATSLVEAGVDFDFPRVWRAEAGLEQIVQAAGRCNREGKRPAAASIVTIFRAHDTPPARELARNAEAFARVMPHHADLSAPDTVERYFQELYWQAGAEQLDRIGVFGRFDVQRGKLGRLQPSFAYRSVAEEFRMVEDSGRPIIIRAPENDMVLKRLWNPKIPSSAIARALQIWTVQVPPRAFEALSKAGKLSFPGGDDRAGQFAILADATLYAPELGLIWEDVEPKGLKL